MRTSTVSRMAGISLILSIVLAIFSIVEGFISRQLGVAIFLFFPVIYGTGLYAAMAVLFVFLSFVLFFVYTSSRLIADDSKNSSAAYGSETRPPHAEEKQTHHKKQFGGVVFIGPVPIIFGSDRRVTGYMLIVAAIMAALIIAALLLGLL
jgi:uncharacterized protein (TIGR00304 family)